jgi:hypothetical protein
MSSEAGGREAISVSRCLTGRNRQARAVKPFREFIAKLLVLTVAFATTVWDPLPAHAQTYNAAAVPSSVIRPMATPVASTAAITIPATIAASIGLAPAANYQVSTDSKWKDYEDVISLAVLNGVTKRAANTGQSLTTAQYSSITAQIRSSLDARKPANPVFADEAAVLRFTIDALVPLVSANPVSPLLAPVIGELENQKLTELMPALNSSRQYPANLVLSTVSVYAFQFIADTVQDSGDLAHNDPQFCRCCKSGNFRSAQC